MDQSILESRSVTLSTGGQVPFLQGVAVAYLVEQLLNGQSANRTLLAQLRTACLTDAPVPEADREPLRDLHLVGPDGRADAVVREVVRASVHGEANGLFFVSPYTDPWDRALSDLIISREKIRGALPPGEAEALIRGAEPQNSQDPSEPGSWLNFVLRRRAEPGSGLPPPSAN